MVTIFFGNLIFATFAKDWSRFVSIATAVGTGCSASVFVPWFSCPFCWTPFLTTGTVEHEWEMVAKGISNLVAFRLKIQLAMSSKIFEIFRGWKTYIDTNGFAVLTAIIATRDRAWGPIRCLSPLVCCCFTSSNDTLECYVIFQSLRNVDVIYLVCLWFWFWTTYIECNTFLSNDNSHCISAFENLFFVTLARLK